MNDEDWLALLVIGGIIVVIAVALGIKTIADSIRSIILDLGAPAAIAGDIGAMVFAAVFLAGLYLVLRVVVS